MTKLGHYWKWSVQRRLLYVSNYKIPLVIYMCVSYVRCRKTTTWASNLIDSGRNTLVSKMAWSVVSYQTYCTWAWPLVELIKLGWPVELLAVSYFTLLPSVRCQSECNGSYTRHCVLPRDVFCLACSYCLEYNQLFLIYDCQLSTS